MAAAIPLETEAGWFSQLVFGFMTPLIRLGKSRPLQAADLPALPDDETVAAALRHYFTALQQSPAPVGLMATWWRMPIIRKPLLLSGLFAVCYVGCQLATPIVLRLLVSALNRGDPLTPVWAAVIACTTLLGAACNQHSLHRLTRVAQRLRAVMVAAVYRRAMGVGATSHSHVSVQSLLSVDTSSFLTHIPLLHSLWSAPLIVVISSYFLVSYLGYAALAGIAVLAGLVPINSLILRKVAAYRKEQMKYTDQRVRLTGEILSGMRVVKLNNWEAPFAAKLLELRAKEMRCLRWQTYLNALQMALLICSPVYSMVLTFTVFTLTGRVQNAADSFAALAFFNTLRFPLQNMSMMISSAVQLRVSIKRLESFLGADGGLASFEAQQAGSSGADNEQEQQQKKEEVPALKLDHAHFAYPSPPSAPAKQSGAKGGNEKEAKARSVQLQPFQLHDITLAIRPGASLAVVGPVGAGKSSLCAALLGEVPRINPPSDAASAAYLPCGLLKGKRVAYAGQMAWIFNGTLRDNITFGHDWDEERYREVLSACCLWQDMSGLSGGDLTAIGEKGVNLSGGQKARVACARVAYARPDVAILDDVLSALDAHTGRQLFEKLLGPRGLFAKYGVARVLVTHAVQVLGECDTVLVLHEGRATFCGSYEELSRLSSAHTTPVLRGARGPAEVKPAPAPQREDDEDEEAAAMASRHDSTQRAALFLASLASAKHMQEGNGGKSGAADADSDDEEDDVDEHELRAQGKKQLATKTDNLIVAEERATGTVKGRVYLEWMKSGGGWMWVALLITGFAAERITYVGTDSWLAAWTAADSNAPRSGLSAQFDFPVMTEVTRVNFFLLGYAIFGLLNGFSASWRTFTFSRICVEAANSMYIRMMWSVWRSPMLFFEQTPIGRILNRCSGDTEVLDSILLQKVTAAVASTFWIASSVIVMVAVLPWMAIVLFIIISLYLVVQTYFRFTSRELQRLDVLSRSPLQSHFTESLSGAATIRAFGAVPRFIAKADDLMNSNNKALLAFQTSTRWLSMRLETLGAIVALAVGLLCWQASGVVPAGYLGLCLLWCLNLTISLGFNALFTTEMEARMVAVERVLHYIEELAPEAPLDGGLPLLSAQPDAAATVAVDAAEQSADVDKPATAVATVLKRARASTDDVIRDIRDHSDVRATSGAAHNWPATGTVAFSNVCMRYRAGLPLALRGLSFTIPSGSLCAVVGRSGSGKSSLVAALLRLVESESGVIEVDGTNIRGLGLTTVRGAGICVVPQEPLLFQASLRFNLDPFSAHTDEELWQALDAVQLAHVFRTQHRPAVATTASSSSNGTGSTEGSVAVTVNPMHASSRGESAGSRRDEGGLSTLVTDDALSQGQKQLLVLARVLLRQPRILLLDEATASVDHATDKLMGRVVRERFVARGCTVISVAHRLHSVIHADQVLVLRAGSLLECGSPHELLEANNSEEGSFAALVRACGPSVESSLRAAAAAAYRERHP